VGAWQLDSEQAAQAGLYLFTPTRYSMVLTATDRPDITDTSKATADELRAIWGPLLANAGTYEISGDLITIHPLVAKIPVVMKPGANEVYQFRHPNPGIWSSPPSGLLLDHAQRLHYSFMEGLPTNRYNRSRHFGALGVICQNESARDSRELSDSV
jgi:hypothetical protein